MVELNCKFKKEGAVLFPSGGGVGDGEVGGRTFLKLSAAILRQLNKLNKSIFSEDINLMPYQNFLSGQK